MTTTVWTENETPVASVWNTFQPNENPTVEILSSGFEFRHLLEVNVGKIGYSEIGG